jgi:hypothetical protein
MDLSLAALASDMAEHRQDGPEALAAILRRRLDLLRPHAVELAWFGADGRPVAATGQLPAPFPATSVLAAHRDLLRDVHVVRLSDALHGPLGAAPPRMLLSRRVSHADGSFAGALVALLAPASFHDRYQDYDPNEAECTLLLGEDGAPLVSWPLDAGAACVRASTAAAASAVATDAGRAGRRRGSPGGEP